ncbi:nitroreductase [Streptomyces sp. NPDC060209]|uniref:nitroreductase n=1 Tax=Streptomyces sp. NPDC060209 TaxID=3347073 RepID=UPI00364971B0
MSANVGSQLDESSVQADMLERILHDRYSCRAFLPDQLEPETIRRLLTMAQRSASWCNSQAWQVVVTSGDGTERFRKALYEAAQTRPMKSDVPEPSEYLGVYQERRRASGYALYESLGIDRGDRERRAQQMLENFRMFGAPHLAVITSEKRLGPYGLVDCGAYVSTLLAAAQSLGIATIAQAAIAMQSDLVREYFSIPDDRDIVCGVSFGLPDHSHPVNSFRTERAPIDDSVEWVSK